MTVTSDWKCYLSHINKHDTIRASAGLKISWKILEKTLLASKKSSNLNPIDQWEWSHNLSTFLTKSPWNIYSHRNCAMFWLVHPVPCQQEGKQSFRRNTWVRSIAKSDHLPQEDPVTPDVALAGVQVVPQGLWRHPFHRY